MKSKIPPYLYIALALLVCLAMLTCKPQKERDITGQQVFLDSVTQVTGYSQKLSWEKITDAASYHLFISDSSNKQLVDTVVLSSQFVYTLGPGNYTLKINARNGFSSTTFSTFKFTIKVVKLNTLDITLSLPVDLGYSDSTTTHLVWVPQYDIAGYQVQVDYQGVFVGNFFLDTILTGTGIRLPILPISQTTYYWRVRAFNGADTSLWSTPSSFTYDITPPGQVILDTPANDSTGAPITGTLKWLSLSLANDLTYTVYVNYGDTAIVVPNNLVNSYNYTAKKAGETVKWKVQAVDLAGNLGLMSEERTFTITTQ